MECGSAGKGGNGFGKAAAAQRPVARAGLYIAGRLAIPPVALKNAALVCAEYIEGEVALNLEVIGKRPGHPFQQNGGGNPHRPGDGDKLQHVDAPFDQFDLVDEGGVLAEPLGQLPL